MKQQVHELAGRERKGSMSSEMGQEIERSGPMG